MDRRPSNRALICLAGLLLSLILIGATLNARQRLLRRATSTIHTPLSGEAEWEGEWEFSERGADPSEAGGERVTIPFVGTDLALQVRRGNYRGYFFVTVDGRPANRLPQNERGAYLVLSSPDHAPQVTTIPVAGGLEEGLHVAVVAAERGWNQWPLVGWHVSRAPETALHDRVAAALGVVAAALMVGALWWGRRAWGSAIGRLRFPRPSLPVAFPAIGQGSGWIGELSPVLPAIAIVAALVFHVSPWLPLTLLGGLALAGLIFLRLDVGLALIAATAPFYLHPRPLLGKTFSLVEIVTLLSALSWGTRMMTAGSGREREAGDERRGPRGPLRPSSSLDLAALLFVVVALGSFFVAEYRHVALRELRVLILEPALFYLMLRTSPLGEKAVWRMVDFFVLGAVAVATIGLAQYALGINVITAEQDFRRLRSVYGSPNSVGLYLGRALPLLAATALFGDARRRRVAYGLALVPLGLAILFSFSKGALLLGVPLSLLALGVLAGGRWLWASVAALLAGAVAALPILRTPRFASLLNTESGTTFFRLQLWRSSWAMFCEHPWLGIGPDNFLYHYRGRYIMPAAWQEPNISQAHNVLLDYATRMGIAGLAVGFWLQIAFWRLALPLRRLKDADRRALALGLMASMVNFLAHGLVDASYFLVDLAFAFFLTLGVVQWLAHWRTRSETHGDQL